MGQRHARAVSISLARGRSQRDRLSAGRLGHCALGDARRQLDEYFDGRRREFDVHLDWRLVGGFRRGVLEATASGVRTPDLGGHATTTEFTDDVIARVRTKIDVWSSLGTKS